MVRKIQKCKSAMKNNIYDTNSRREEKNGRRGGSRLVNLRQRDLQCECHLFTMRRIGTGLFSVDSNLRFSAGHI